MTRNKLYLFVIIACIAGYLWVAWSLWYEKYYPNEHGIELCLFRKVTQVPCPSCGSTRSVMSVFKGELKQAVLYNPMGFVVIIIMLITPPWIVFDFILQKDSFWQWYKQGELFLKKRIVAILFVILVVANWIWNIIKYF